MKVVIQNLIKHFHAVIGLSLQKKSRQPLCGIFYCNAQRHIKIFAKKEHEQGYKITNMQAEGFKIPFYKEINDFLESITTDLRTKNPNFYCLKLKPNESSMANYKPPFKKDFYFLALITNAGETKITYDNTNVTELNSFLVFQSPNLLYSFFRDNSANGYLIYFKKDCFSFFKPDFEKEFPFFNILQTNFFKLNQAKFKEFAPNFKEVLTAYEGTNDQQHTIATIKLLTLLYQLGLVVASATTQNS